MNKQIVLVIGGPGKSGSSTIAKMLAEYFQVQRVYGGQLFREEAERNGFFSVNDYLKNTSQKQLEELDRFVDEKLRVHARTSSAVIESKVFAALATIENIPCTYKIWVEARLEVRVERALNKQGIKNPILKWPKRYLIKKSLVSRYEIDKNRYKRLYGIEYDQPEKYNNLVIDNSDQTPEETFNLIIKSLKDAGINTER